MYIHTKVQTCVGGTHASTKMHVLPFNSGYIIYVTCTGVSKFFIIGGTS